MIELLAEVRSYDDLLNALRARMASLNSSSETVDEVAGPREIFEQDPKPDSAQWTRARQSWPGAGALGVKLVLVQDEEQFERVRSRLVPRNAYGRVPTTKGRKPSPFLGDSRWGKEMRARGLLKQTAQKRTSSRGRPQRRDGASGGSQ
jgi:hypothetical protein